MAWKHLRAMRLIAAREGIYRRDPEGLVFLGEPSAGEPSALASPVCYATEVDPGHFGERQE